MITGVGFDTVGELHLGDDLLAQLRFFDASPLLSGHRKPSTPNKKPLTTALGSTGAVVRLACLGLGLSLDLVCVPVQGVRSRVTAYFVRGSLPLAVLRLFGCSARLAQRAFPAGWFTNTAYFVRGSLRWGMRAVEDVAAVVTAYFVRGSFPLAVLRLFGCLARLAQRAFPVGWVTDTAYFVRGTLRWGMRAVEDVAAVVTAYFVRGSFPLGSLRRLTLGASGFWGGEDELVWFTGIGL